MTSDEFRALVLSFPDVEEGFNMASVVFKANGKVVARLLSQTEAMLAGMTYDERELLLESRPEVFRITPHYKDYRGVIARLAPLDSDTCRLLLERRWREAAPKSLVKAFDAAKERDRGSPA
ncbi:MAG: MmcQ/YjbR family DNA-binding protein [Phenylobacterium sp.]|jgi:hypothetical protein|uniref:MmcQ/YjbR family DNA-binding protein n=1 Tax=Phenylobacterium sp. TaxID=1871053 RepID=UPI003918ADCA